MQIQAIKTSEDGFIKFLVECIVNLVLGNFKEAKKEQFKSHIILLEKLGQQNHTHDIRHQKKLLANLKGLALLNDLAPFIFKKFASRKVGFKEQL
jgi:hypothetical protein